MDSAQIAQNIETWKTKRYPKGNKECDYLKECASSKRKIYYSVDTLSGFSGAPVLGTPTKGGRFKVIGIHNGALEKMEKANQANFAHSTLHFMECIKNENNLKPIKVSIDDLQDQVRSVKI